MIVPVPDEIEFRITITILFALTLIVRSYYQLQSLRSGKSEQFESPGNVAVRSIAGIALLCGIAIYVFRPQWLEWASIPFPRWLRWLGVPVGIAALVLLSLVHRELGRNFSGTLHLLQEHQLIMSGPYRRVRHPMYTAFFLIGLTLLLLSADWLLGAGLIAGVSAVMLSRLRNEERVMVDRFGSQYRAYMERTGRFLPKLKTPS
jgi:protein-S-isoprenylcysteine O-methyltransferase Ste14